MSGFVQAFVTRFGNPKAIDYGGGFGRRNKGEIRVHDNSLTITRHRETRAGDPAAETAAAYVDHDGRAELARRLVASLPRGYTLKRLSVAEYQTLEDLLDRLMGPGIRG